MAVTRIANSSFTSCAVIVEGGWMSNLINEGKAIMREVVEMKMKGFKPSVNYEIRLIIASKQVSRLMWRMLNFNLTKLIEFRNFASAILNVTNIVNETTLVSDNYEGRDGPFVLQLGKNTDVLVGFFPSSDNPKTFDGCIKQLQFDDELMGLWYWKVKLSSYIFMCVCMYICMYVCIYVCR